MSLTGTTIKPRYLNSEAYDLRKRLVDLVYDLKALAGAAHRAGKPAWDAHDQLDAVSCQLAAISESLPDVFDDVTRDRQDQRFAIVLPE